MDLAEARAILGVSAADDWIVVRAAYRDQVRRSHPDLAGAGGTAETVALNAAYRSLALARREGRLHDDHAAHAAHAAPTAPTGPRSSGPAPRATRTEWLAPEEPAPDVERRDHDTLALSSTPPEAFRRLVEAAHAIGDVSYIDRSSAIFEAVVTLEDGKAASLVVSLQWRAHDATCEAFCTLEALDRAEHLDVGGVVEQLVAYIPPDREADVGAR